MITKRLNKNFNDYKKKHLVIIFSLVRNHSLKRKS